MTSGLLDARLWVAIVISCAFSLIGGYIKGKHEANIANQLEIAKANDKSRESERMASQALQNINAQYFESKTNAQSQINALRADVRNGAMRLSVRSVQAAIDPATSGGTIKEARAELLPQDADDLIGIAGECDANVRQLNSVIDAFNSVKKIINNDF